MYFDGNISSKMANLDDSVETPHLINNATSEASHFNQ